MRKEIESTITKPLCTTSVPNKDPVSDSFEPQTLLGKKLLMLRKSYAEKGHPLLNDVEFDKELNSRRGGVFVPENTEIVTDSISVLTEAFDQRQIAKLNQDVNQIIEDFFNNLDCRKI